MTMKTELLALLRREWVTPLYALEAVNCLSLSQRCGELRRDGHTVLDKWVSTQSGKRIKAYRVARVAK